MRLAHVTIANYRSIKQIDFDFLRSGILVLVGPNNAGKSNIIRAINCVCGEEWFGPDKAEDYDHYLRDRTRGIQIALRFDDGTSGAILPSERWPRYLDPHGNKIWGSNLKDDFPCTYLGADRSFARQLSFYDWTLMGRIRRTFHRRALPLQDELRDRFQSVVEVFDEVDGFAQFKADFTTFFSEMQADSRAKLSLDFKPFTPSNYFKTMQILASDPDQSDQPLDLDELGEGSRNMVLLALLRSYALNLRSRGEIGGILALEEPEGLPTSAGPTPSRFGPARHCC